MSYQAPSSSTLRALSPQRALGWYDFAEAWLTFPLGRLLDYGCGTGAMCVRIGPRCGAYVGVDVDADRARQASAMLGADIRPISPDEPLPFEDESFDSAIILEVIEHVADERVVLAEIARVLKPGGRLLLTTPHKGLLTFIDPGNVKFVAPWLHRFVHQIVLRQKSYYEERFGQSRRTERGLLADFTTDHSPWHRHYTAERIRALAPSDLVPVASAVYFPAFRALWMLRMGLKVLTFGRLNSLPWPLSVANRSLSRCTSRWGDQLVMLFEKRR